MSKMHEFSSFWHAEEYASDMAYDYPCPFTVYVNIESRKFFACSGDKEIDGYIKIVTHGCYDDDDDIVPTDKPVSSAYDTMLKHNQG